ncbi:sugar ABC transporter substrate-binding protein [Spirochaetia bacterium]|nr:sugar ABC transporter substrate-binding protein [Spirochaetia bacterium]
MKKLLAAAVVLTVVGSIFISCSKKEGAGGAAKTADGVVTLDYLIWDEEQAPAMQAMIDGFQSKNSSIKVELTATPWGQYMTKIQTMLGTGTAPDIFWMSTAVATQYMPMGVLEPLTPLAQRDGYDLSKLNPNILKAYTHEGKLYGIPKDIDCFVVFYNKELFDKAGVPYPKDNWTWEDFRSTAKALTKGGVYGFGPPSEDRVVNGILWSFGGDVYASDRMRAVVNSPENIAAFTLLTNMWKTDKSSPTGPELIETDPSNMFINGIIAMEYNGSWVLSTNSEALGDKLGIVEVPTGPAGKRTTSHGIGFGTPAGGAKRDAAWEFLKYLGGAEAQEKQAAMVIPANSDASAAWVKQYPNYDLSPIVRALEYSPTNPLALKNTVATRNLFIAAIQEIWLGGDIPSVLSSAQTSMNAEINK